MVSYLKIEHGKETCAIDVGKFCRFLLRKKLGTLPYCGLYDVALFHESGWLKRDKACVKELGEDE